MRLIYEPLFLTQCKIYLKYIKCPPCVIYSIMSKLQVCLEEFSDIRSCLFCGCLDDKKPEPLSSFRFSKNEASVYGKHTGADEDQRFPWWWSILPRQWAASLFENPAVCWWLTSAGRRQTALAATAVSVNCLGSGWTGGCHCQRIQLTAKQPPFSTLPARPWKGPRPGAKAREEDNHFQQNKPARSISTL